MKDQNLYSNLTRKSIQSLIMSLFFCGMIFLSLPQNNYAYDNDTHFWLTYYLAIKAGYTSNQAAQIASADVSVDYDPDTTPVLANFDTWKDVFQPLSQFQIIVQTFHALPNKSEVEDKSIKDWFWWDPTVETDRRVRDKAHKLVQRDKNIFWKTTLDNRKNPGVFLHFAQDVYAHRNFKSWLGHSGYFYVDFLASNPQKAEEMALNTLKYLILFRKHFSGDHLDADSWDVNLVDNSGIEKFIATNDISQDDLKQIKETVREFIKANQLPPDKPQFDSEEKYISNRLVDRWNAFSLTKKKSHYKLIPLSYLSDLWKISAAQPVPNSHEARKSARKALGVDDKDLPYIWRYNFRNGFPNYLESEVTNQAYVYKKGDELEKYSKIKNHLAKYEEANKQLKRMCSSNKTFNMPFALQTNAPTDIHPCN